MVAVVRKLAELVWHLLTKEREFLYAVPKRTIDKLSGWQLLAKRKIGIELKSAAKKAIGRPVLYGTGEAGTRIKRGIVQRAAEQSERIYAAIVSQKQSPVENEKLRHEYLVFDSTRPVQTDWEQVLTKVSERLITAKKQKA